ncbi:hypothetical protein HZS_5189 [Henneguya salminicola]|nr:hypothetical protein HZS_5189 [Henneguya salminicola]
MIRQRINLPLTILSDAVPLILPKQYKISFRNENFLQYDGLENDGERFILFEPPHRLNILSRNSDVYFDSPFKSVHEIFYQLFVINGEYNNVLIPCAFASMERKTEICLEEFWRKREKMLKSHAKLPGNTSINSFVFCYPSTPLTICFFHFRQCIWCRIQSGGQSSFTAIMKQRENL